MDVRTSTMMQQLLIVWKMTFHTDASIKRRKTNNDAIATKYINLSILCATSVACERLLSVAKNIVKAIMLLKMNRSE
jgi:hypothetical protein